jgi:hypothetical protein
MWLLLSSLHFANRSRRSTPAPAPVTEITAALTSLGILGREILQLKCDTVFAFSDLKEPLLRLVTRHHLLCSPEEFGRWGVVVEQVATLVRGCLSFYIEQLSTANRNLFCLVRSCVLVYCGEANSVRLRVSRGRTCMRFVDYVR